VKIIYKPFDLDKLLATVRTIIDGPEGNV